jgi:hypothetical protein
MTITVDTAKLPTLLTALRLPTIARLWPDFCARADKEGWPAARLLAALAELALAEREQRRGVAGSPQPRTAPWGCGVCTDRRQGLQLCEEMGDSWTPGICAEIDLGDAVAAEPDVEEPILG